jgi:hypothetical protein
MNSNSSSRASHHLYSSRDRVPVKKPFAHAIGLDKVVGIFFEKFRKNKEGIVPWVPLSRERLCTSAKTLAAQPQILSQTCEHNQR